MQQKLQEKLKAKQVLIVDDDLLFNEIFQEMLEGYGMDVSVARDGSGALMRYRAGDFELVVTDIEMPNGDGIELCEEIKRIDPGQKIVVLSSHDDREYLTRLLNIGVEGFLIKPFKIQKLETLLEKLF